MHDQPRLLIVEDSAAQRERLERITSNPPSSWTEGTGVRAFRVHTAGTAEEARALSGRANQESWAYEAVLLDLRLPATKEDAAEQREDVVHAQSLLREFARPETSVVILTACPDSVDVDKALRNGATERVHVNTSDECSKMPINEMRKSLDKLCEFGASGRPAMGVFLARMVVEQHGGKLELRSKVGEGTTVSMVFPVVGSVNEVD